MSKSISSRLVRPPNGHSLRFACIALIALGGTVLLRDGPGASPARAQTAAPAGSALTIEQIGDALDKYGKNTITQNGHTDYSLNVQRGKWNMNVIVSVSPNGRVIWMTNSLVGAPDAGAASPAALLNLLKKNYEIGPMFFSIAHGSVRISNPVPNHDLTPDGVREQVDALVATVVDTEPLWNPSTLAGHQSPPKGGNGNGNGNPLGR